MGSAASCSILLLLLLRVLSLGAAGGEDVRDGMVRDWEVEWGMGRLASCRRPIDYMPLTAGQCWSIGAKGCFQFISWVDLMKCPLHSAINTQKETVWPNVKDEMRMKDPLHWDCLGKIITHYGLRSNVKCEPHILMRDIPTKMCAPFRSGEGKDQTGKTVSF